MSTYNHYNNTFLKFAVSASDRFYETINLSDTLNDKTHTLPTMEEYGTAPIGEQASKRLSDIIYDTNGKRFSEEISYPSYEEQKNPTLRNRTIRYIPNTRWKGFSTQDYNRNTDYLRKRYDLGNYKSDLQTQYNIPVFTDAKEFYSYKPKYPDQDGIPTNEYLEDNYYHYGSAYQPDTGRLPAFIQLAENRILSQPTDKDTLYHNHFTPSALRFFADKTNKNMQKNTALMHELIHATSDPATSNSEEVMEQLLNNPSYSHLRDKIIGKHGYFSKLDEFSRVLKGAKMTALSIWPLSEEERKPENYQEAITRRINKIHNLTENQINALWKANRLRPSDLDVIFRGKAFFHRLNNSGANGTTPEFEFVRRIAAPVAHNNQQTQNQHTA